MLKLLSHLKTKQPDKLKKRKLLLRARKRKRRRRRARRKARKVRMTMMVSLKLLTSVHLKLFKDSMSNTRILMKTGTSVMKVKTTSKSMMSSLRKLKFFPSLKKNTRFKLMI